MKRLLFLLPISFLLLLVQPIQAQTPSTEPTVYWKFITERSQVDFFYRIVDCNKAKQVYLKVKNDLPQERVISFTVEINGSVKITKEISIHAVPVAILEPDCSDKEKNKTLCIELPIGFDTSSTEVKIRLHE